MFPLAVPRRRGRVLPVGGFPHRLNEFLVAEKLQVEFAERFGVGDEVYTDDLVPDDREAECHRRLPMLQPNESRSTVDQCRLCGPGSSRERVGHGRRSADFLRRTHLDGGGIGSRGYFPVEGRKKGGGGALWRPRGERNP